MARPDADSYRASIGGGAFFMFMGNNHRYRPNNPKRNPWDGVVGLEKAPKPVVMQTELSRDNPMPEPARKSLRAQELKSRAAHGSLSYRDAPHPPAYAKPSRGAYSARGPAAANVGARDYMDELDGDYAYSGGGAAAAHPGAYTGVGGADPSLEMWVTGTLPGAPKSRNMDHLLLPGIQSHRSPRGGSNQRQQQQQQQQQQQLNKRREGANSLGTQKKVGKAIKLIRSILSSWDSSLVCTHSDICLIGLSPNWFFVGHFVDSHWNGSWQRKTFNTIDADRAQFRRLHVPVLYFRYDCVVVPTTVLLLSQHLNTDS
jgi:hypothetical protein